MCVLLENSALGPLLCAQSAYVHGRIIACLDREMSCADALLDLDRVILMTIMDA